MSAPLLSILRGAGFAFGNLVFLYKEMILHNKDRTTYIDGVNYIAKTK